jgi:hypothetical protein
MTSMVLAACGSVYCAAAGKRCAGPTVLLLLLQIKGFAKSLRGGDGDAPSFWMKLLGPKGPPPVRQPVSV